jgi:hypothetical protein
MLTNCTGGRDHDSVRFSISSLSTSHLRLKQTNRLKLYGITIPSVAIITGSRSIAWDIVCPTERSNVDTWQTPCTSYPWPKWEFILRSGKTVRRWQLNLQSMVDLARYRYEGLYTVEDVCLSSILNLPRNRRHRFSILGAEEYTSGKNAIG